MFSNDKASPILSHFEMIQAYMQSPLVGQSLWGIEHDRPKQGLPYLGKLFYVRGTSCSSAMMVPIIQAC